MRRTPRIPRVAVARGSAARCVLFACGFLTWAFSGTQNEAKGLFFPQLRAEFGHSVAPRQLALVAATFSLGTTAGTGLAGLLGDSHGRRALSLLAVLGGTLSAALAFWSPSFGCLLAARACLGICAGLLTVSVPTLMAESLPNEGLQATMASYPCGWPLGAAVVFGLALQPWRLALGGVPLIVAVALGVLLSWLPESPKYLTLKGRHGEARMAAARLSTQVSDAEQHPAAEAAGGDAESGSLPFWRIGIAFFLRGGASMAVKLWLPIWLATTSGDGDVKSFLIMYGLEAAGILVTAALISTGDSSGGGGRMLATVARTSFAVSAIATAGCLFIKGHALLAGLLGAAHLLAQANIYNMLAPLAALSVPTRKRASMLSRFALLDFLGGSLLPLLLAADVRPHGATFTGVSTVLVAAAALYALGFATVPIPRPKAMSRSRPKVVAVA